MNQVIDFSTLTWVKHELDETLREARQALETHVENPSDRAQLGFLSAHLHQVYGTLQMVELYGAALLAEEMEHVAHALSTDSVSKHEEACEVLMRAILQLPDYLDRLIAGYRDIPVVLLPILNDLRAVRGEPLLSDNAMFSPDFGAEIPESVTRKSSEVTSRASLKELRHRFQLGLLGWLRGHAVDDSLASMAKVLGELLDISTRSEVSRLWWVAGGVVESLADGTLDPAVAVKRLFSQVDREIKRVSDEGESVVAREPALDLLKNLLFYAAQSSGNGAQISSIKSVYKLSDLLPAEEEIAAARESMSGQNADLFATVSAAVKEELARLKDSLDIVLRSGTQQADELIPLVDSLNSLGDTLGMLGLDAPRKAMLAKAGDLRGYTEDGRIPPETLIMDVASTLLFVESSVEGLGSGQVGNSDDKSIGEQVAKTEYDQVMGVVLQEAIADLGRGKDAIVSYAESQQQSELLDPVPQLFNQVKGGLLLLGETRAAALIGALSRYIENELIRNKKQPPQDELDSLADSICGLEYFLEGRKEHRMFGVTAISLAEESVVKLGYPAEEDESEVEVHNDEEAVDLSAIANADMESKNACKDSDLDGVCDIPDASVQDANDTELEISGVDGKDNIEDDMPSEMSEPGAPIELDQSICIEACDDKKSDPSVNQVSVNSESEVTDSVVGSDLEQGVVAEISECSDECDALPIIGADTDEEILEIFLEEAEEEINSINCQLPIWIGNQEDGEALASVRRSYHTLKGSGRLVGAMRIGEFAWAYETMLNRLIDGTITVSASMFELLTAGSVALEELVRQIKDGSPVKQPVAYLMQCAAALSKGEVLPVVCDDKVDTNPDKSLGTVEIESSEFSDDHPPATDILDDPETDYSPASGDTQTSIPVYGEGLTESPKESVDSFAVNVMDPMLYEIFNAESRGHLEVIRQYLNRVENGDSAVDEDLARALHTLHGSAHMANAPSIADLSGELERYVKALLSAGMPMPDTGCAALQNSAQMIETMLDSLPMEISPQEELGSVTSQLQELRQSVPVTNRDSLAANVDSDLAANDITNLDEGKNAEQIVQEDDSSHSCAYSDCDQELLDIFIEESQENLDVCETTLGLWRKCRDDNAAVDELQRALHTLKGGARMAGLPQFGDLVHVVESLVATQRDCSADATDAVLDVVAQANDALVGMLDCVKDHTRLESPDHLIDEIEELRSSLEFAVVANPDDANSIGGESGETEPQFASEEKCTTQEDVDPYADVDTELLEVFLEEAYDILEHSDETLRSWRSSPEDPGYIAQLQRELHTLKGGARMADITDIGDLAHAVESLMVKVADGAIGISEPMFTVLHQAHDVLNDMIERVKRRRPLSQDRELMQKLDALHAGKNVQEDSPATAVSASDQSMTRKEVVGEKTVAGDRRSKERGSQELVRVKASLLDNMVNYAGEVSIYRSRLEQKVGAYRFNLVEMEQTIARLREQLRKMEIETEAQVLFRYETENVTGDDQFDPLEMDRYSHMQQLSRSLVESVSDLGSIQNLLENLTGESETLLLQQSRVNTELQEGLMRTRMVPFLGLAARMRRIVRQTCQTVGKKAELELSGAEGEMDRTVVDRIIAPIEHMLRNAVSHGIEMPQSRLAAGKSEAGIIRITLERESSDVVLRIIDDGAGIDLKAIRQKAIERGLMAADAGISDDEALQFILETGFSTAEKVTQVAGRGVGMDVVNSEVKQLGGSLHIASLPGKGTTFTMRLPFTLALNQALLVEVGEDTYAIPLSSIEGIVRMRREDLAGYYEHKNSKFTYADFDYDVCHLGTLLGTGTSHIDSGPRSMPVLLARVGEHGVAFQVENLLGSREIVVKSVGPQISTVRGVSGATILGDGRVVMILDLIALLRGGLATSMAQVEDIVSRPKSTRQLVVMVVDDSITVRKVTTRLLERNDMNVITAKDGVDAVSKLQDNIPDIMLLDIEMPRMDGFELATHVRNESRLRGIPIIMITSRTGDKHRQRAMQIGVNRYLGKPFQEAELLGNIKELIEEQ